MLNRVVIIRLICADVSIKLLLIQCMEIISSELI